MYRALFELIGGFVFWTLSGFKGSYETHLDRDVNYKTAILGGLTFFALLFIVIIAVKLIWD